VRSPSNSRHTEVNRGLTLSSLWALSRWTCGNLGICAPATPPVVNLKAEGKARVNPGLHYPHDVLCDSGSLLSLLGPLLPLPFSEGLGAQATLFWGSLKGRWKGGVKVGKGGPATGPLTGPAHLGWCQEVVDLWSQAVAVQPGHSALALSHTPAGAARSHRCPAAGPEAPRWLPLALPPGTGPLQSSCRGRCPCEQPLCLPTALTFCLNTAPLNPGRLRGSG
jgi:hypothetical protein